MDVPPRFGMHNYLSTSCFHAAEPGREELHDYCQNRNGQAGPKKPGECKFCEAKCVCRCHQVGAVVPV